MEDVECLIVSPEDHAVTEDVETVERQRLPTDQTVGLHPVLDGLVAQPSRDVTERVPGEAGTVPVTEVARLTAGEHVVRLGGMEDHLTDGGLVSREKCGRMGWRAKVPDCQDPVLSPRHHDVALGGVGGQASHCSALAAVRHCNGPKWRF